jgi:hypothetical protein
MTKSMTAKKPKKIEPEDQAAYQPLRIAIKQSQCLPRNTNALEVFNAFKFTFGESPKRNDQDVCVYTARQLEIIAATCSIEASSLMELEEWRKIFPLAGCASRMAAMEKLARLESHGWLQRLSYKRGRLLLSKEDAELLCYRQKTGYQARPLRWAVPTMLAREGCADE